MTYWPRLTRTSPAPQHGIVHLGLGAFFRSHGALVIEESARRDGGDWGITGVSLRSADVRDALVPQGCVYTAVELSPTCQKRRTVNVLRDVIFALEAPEDLVALMADPSTRIVSLTVTEKGYCHRPSTGTLDETHPDVAHDLNHNLPRSSIGFIVRALQERHRAGMRPFTVLSCDNLPDNGALTRNVVCDMAARIDSALATWIEREGRFPSTMVDRIVPATTDGNIADLAVQTGRLDAAPVFHEPFLQWVIEDDFVENDRPAFDCVPGVQLVEDVAPYELMKLRMLNGTHSALAYLGYLAGHETIFDTVADDGFRAFITRVWSSEIVPALSPPADVDLYQYAEDLLIRYENPAIRHRTWQIAMDGSQKLPQRILGTLAENAKAGRPSPGLCLAVAAWMRYVGGVDEQGQPIDVRDPLADRLRSLSDSMAAPRDRARMFLSVSEVFGDGMDEQVADAICERYYCLERKGAAACVEAFCRLSQNQSSF